MSKSIKGVALIVALGTLASKAGGLIRQIVIAGAFGVGAAYDAYNYAYIIPGFFLVLLGGINGPFDNAIVSVLSKKNKVESKSIISSINGILSLFLVLISILIFLNAETLIHIVGPGLSPEIHKIAVIQLKLMSPIALLSGLIGIGFGVLNSNEKFFLPSISPLSSSIVITLLVALFWIKSENSYFSEELSLKGGIILAIATLTGAIIQLGIQIPLLIKSGFRKIKLKLNLNQDGVKEVLQILWPATIASGMLQINVFTDLFFASEITGAASGLSYANFIIQAPLGLASNALLIPLLPSFSKLANTKKWPELSLRIRQGIIFSSLAMISLGSLFVSLNTPIVEIIYGRGAFDNDAINLVSRLLIAYGFGMPFYLIRDLLVRVFYGIGDAKTPYYLSLAGIFFNIFFDWIFIGGPSPWGNQSPINLGASGIIIATVIINFLTCLALSSRLKNKIALIPIRKLALDFSKVLLAGIACNITTTFFQSIITWDNSLMGIFTKVICSSSIGLFMFLITCNLLGVKEVNVLLQIIQKRFIRRN